MPEDNEIEARPRPKPRGRGRADAKILAPRPLWPRGLNITVNSKFMCAAVIGCTA